jgi:hypothetical protein
MGGFMDVNLDQTEGEWFQFVGSRIDLNTGEAVFEDPFSDARVQVRSIAPFIEERISKRKRIVEHVHNPKTRQMERLSYFEEPTFEQAKTERDDTWDYAITAFENFKNKKTGEVITCTRENKLKLMKNPVFDRFISRCLQIIASSGTEAKEESGKNS